MPKTYFGEQSIRTIETLNDQLWYYVFATQELNYQLNNFSDKAKEIYTVDLFKNNPYARKIHIQVGKLSKFQDENKNATFAAYFGMCYEICSKYLITAFDTLRSMNALTKLFNDNGLGPEERLEKFLQVENLPPVSNNIIDTVTYLRLRRNHYTHISEQPNAKLMDFINVKAIIINSHWAISGTIIELDFTKDLIRDFTLEETIELIKLTRICIQTIDIHVSGLLDKSAIVDFEIEKELKGKRMRLNRITKSNLVDKIRNNCKMDFDIVVDINAVESKLSAI